MDLLQVNTLLFPSLSMMFAASFRLNFHVDSPLFLCLQKLITKRRSLYEFIWKFCIHVDTYGVANLLHYTIPSTRRHVQSLLQQINLCTRTQTRFCVSFLACFAANEEMCQDNLLQNQSTYSLSMPLHDLASFIALA